jgi:hypothetical protein
MIMMMIGWSIAAIGGLTILFAQIFIGDDDLAENGFKVLFIGTAIAVICIFSMQWQRMLNN